MKSIWKGSLSFGLINIPIQVYPASDEHALEFHMLHKKDLSPIKYARICAHDGKEVPYNDIVKGYEYQKGEFVVIEADDFKAANAKKTSTVEIQQFTNINEIDPVFFEKPYFLEPDKKAVKAYQLLNAALEKSGKVAIANFVFRNREHIGAIIPSKEGLHLLQMRYKAEMRDFKDFALPKEKVNPKEMEMAISLIKQQTKPFKPDSFHDTYSEELMHVIQQKLKGKRKTKPKAEEKAVKAPRPATDLMGLLQASLQKKPNARRLSK